MANKPKFFFLFLYGSAGISIFIVCVLFMFPRNKTRVAVLLRSVLLFPGQPWLTVQVFGDEYSVIENYTCRKTPPIPPATPTRFYRSFSLFSSDFTLQCSVQTQSPVHKGLFGNRWQVHTPKSRRGPDPQRAEFLIWLWPSMVSASTLAWPFFVR